MTTSHPHIPRLDGHRPIKLIVTLGLAIVFAVATFALSFRPSTAGAAVPASDDRPVVNPGTNGSFTSPSENITCTMNESSGVACHVFEHSWNTPIDPSCDVDQGDNVSLNRSNGVHYGCYSDVYWDTDATPLAYGHSMVVGDYRCDSDTTGVTCTDAGSGGRGFKVARADLTTIDASVGDRPVVRPGDHGLFTSPSGNIACAMNEGSGITCRVTEQVWDMPLGCIYDFDNEVRLDRQGLHQHCVSDVSPTTASGPDIDVEAAPLRYGSTMIVGDYRCDSERTGVTCTNTALHLGFTASRTSLTHVATDQDGRQRTVVNPEAGSFTSPSGNISCFMAGHLLSCHAAKHSWTTPDDPTCDVGQGGDHINLDIDGVDYTCQLGGQPWDTDAEPLPYGQTMIVDGNRCDSDTTGVTCTMTVTGKGFTMSRADLSITG